MVATTVHWHRQNRLVTIGHVKAKQAVIASKIGELTDAIAELEDHRPALIADHLNHLKTVRFGTPDFQRFQQLYALPKFKGNGLHDVWESNLQAPEEPPARMRDVFLSTARRFNNPDEHLWWCSYVCPNRERFKGTALLLQGNPDAAYYLLHAAGWPTHL